jgi:hypothetical protein
MRLRSTSAAAAAGIGALALAASAGAAMIGIYRNGMESTAQRAQLVKLTGRDCARAGSGGALRITIGERTPECAYRTPVLGRDLEVAATERLLSTTPKPAQHKAYLGAVLRAGGGAKYEMLVFPLQRKVQLVKIVSGGAEYLAIDRNEPAVQGLGKPNVLRLRAVNVTSGPEQGQARLLAYLGGSLVAEATDEGAGDLSGRASGVAVGATKSAKGVVASVDDVVVRVPSPF